jgi:hypothetical protein
LTPDILTNAAVLSDTIQRTDRRRAFVAAVTRFVQLLATVPDHPSRELSADSVAALSGLAESVISRIESRVSTANDPGAVQVDLIASVYDIRRDLEEIDRWRRHPVGGTS